MKKRKIITYPNPILRKKAAPVEDPTSNYIKLLVDEMIYLMNKAQGIGLAAPQVAESKRLVIINTDDGPLPLINPEIIKFSEKKVDSEEGCLSLPKLFGVVKRPEEITLKAQDLSGETFEFTANDLLARVIQHEIDHLNGVLFPDIWSKKTHGEFDKSLENKK